ncbi:hypothetical protein LTR66_016163, partial [Elasticomyces elasticus]
MAPIQYRNSGVGTEKAPPDYYELGARSGKNLPAIDEAVIFGPEYARFALVALINHCTNARTMRLITFLTPDQLRLLVDLVLPSARFTWYSAINSIMVSAICKFMIQRSTERIEMNKNTIEPEPETTRRTEKDITGEKQHDFVPELASELVLETPTLGELVGAPLIREFAIEMGNTEDPPTFSSFEGYREAQVDDDVSEAAETRSEADTAIDTRDNESAPMPLAPVAQIAPIQPIQHADMFQQTHPLQPIIVQAHNAMPAPYKQDQLYFDDENATEFLENYQETCHRSGIYDNKRMMELLPSYCSKTTRHWIHDQP